MLIDFIYRKLNLSHITRCMASELALQERLECASLVKCSEEARSIWSRSAFSNRSARASAPGRLMRSEPTDGNDSRGGSVSLLAQSKQSSSKSQTSQSQPPQSDRAPAVITLDTTSSFSTPSLTSASTACYTSSTLSSHFDPSLFNAAACNELVEFYLLRFVERFKLNFETDRAHLDLLEDELHAAYHANQPLPEEQIDAAMRAIYNSHVRILACAFAPLQNQPAVLATEDDAAPTNLEIDAVIPPPLDDACNAHRAAREQAAAPSDGPGDDDDDDGLFVCFQVISILAAYLRYNRLRDPNHPRLGNR